MRRLRWGHTLWRRPLAFALLLAACGPHHKGTFSKVGGADYDQICALTTEGEAVCWDWTRFGTWVPVDRAQDLGVYGPACALTVAGLECWDARHYGEDELAPLIPGTWASLTASGVGRGWCALDAAGFATCGGDDITAGVVADLLDQAYTQLALAYSVCALDTEGSVSCFETNPDEPPPPALPGVYDTISVDAWDRLCGLSDGVATCTAADLAYDPGVEWTDPPQGERFVSLDASGGTTCGITDAGSISCWGLVHEDGTYQFEQLGSPDFDSEVIGFEPAGTYADVYADEYTSCAIDTDGCIACWGESVPFFPSGGAPQCVADVVEAD